MNKEEWLSRYKAKFLSRLCPEDRHNPDLLQTIDYVAGVAWDEWGETEDPEVSADEEADLWHE